MAARFDYFVVLADMRTGSNLLQAALNGLDGITCHGELFNPHFVGGPKKTSMFGVGFAERDKAPLALISAMRGQTGGCAGFRLFSDHDRRVRDHCLGDERCGKIVLTRDPVEAYVSQKIAVQTDQWRLSDVSDRRSAQARFDADDFAIFLDARMAFQLEISRALQLSGQTAFCVTYDDIQDVEVINGIGQFLGAEGRLKRMPSAIKKQNPSPLEAKVSNFDEMEAALAGFDRFDLSRVPNFEPKRGARIPGFVGLDDPALLFLPVPGTAVSRVTSWMADMGPLVDGFTQKTLRQWKRGHPGHASFTTISHPVVRAWRGYRRHILTDGPQPFPVVRQRLADRYDVPELSSDADTDVLRRGFLAFLGFVRANLSGQTSLGVAPEWATQTSHVTGFAHFMVPDRVVREDEFESAVAQMLGPEAGAAPPGDLGIGGLTSLYDASVEKAVRLAYPRDYMMFGFGDWPASRSPHAA
ncbi:MAG: nodulation protein NodH [Pseudomonadota bacterium]